jgi:hypothetical protein
MRILVVMITRARHVPDTPSRAGPTLSSGGSGFGGSTVAIVEIRVKGGKKKEKEGKEGGSAR